MLLALGFVGLVAWSWGKWPDPLVDFGRELYIPWQLAEGKTLYRDLAYFNGPLSPIWNSWIFRGFGASLRALVITNLAIVVLITALLGFLLRRFGDRLTSTAGIAVFWCLFAFAQLIYQGNYNFVTPYSHEMTHGTALTLAALAVLAVHLRTGGLGSAFGCGVLVGSSFLTKPEFFVAILPAVAVPLVVVAARRRGDDPRPSRRLFAFATGCSVPVLAAFVLLLLRLPAPEALRGLLGGWLHVFDRRLSGLELYREILGTTSLGENLIESLQWVARSAAALGLALVVAFAMRRASKDFRPGTVLLVPLFALIPLFRLETTPWQEAAQPLPFLLLGMLAATTFHLRPLGADPEDLNRRLLQWSCLVYSLLLLLKMLFHTRIAHYGFALALPGALILVVALLERLPRWVESRGGNGAAMRAAVLGLLVGVVAVHLYATNSWYRLKTIRVGTGSDAFLADPRGELINRALDELEHRREPGDTLAVVPEGVVLNYLGRIENSTPFVNFMPPELIMFGEAAIVEAFEERPPEWIVIPERLMPEYGYRSIGLGYGEELIAWIERNYRLAARLTSESQSRSGLRWAMILVPRAADSGDPEAEAASEVRP